MKTYVKKPIVVVAVEFTGNNCQEIRDFIGGKYAGTNIDKHGNCNGIKVKTNHGIATGYINDFFIRSEKGEHYPCSGEEFHANYDWVE